MTVTQSFQNLVLADCKDSISYLMRGIEIAEELRRAQLEKDRLLEVYKLRKEALQLNGERLEIKIPKEAFSIIKDLNPNLDYDDIGVFTNDIMETIKRHLAIVELADHLGKIQKLNEEIEKDNEKLLKEISLSNGNW